MATKSILKNINIEDKKSGQSFISALENSQKKSCKEVVITKACSNIKRDKIKSMFGAGK
jgi:hypothetical protein